MGKKKRKQAMQRSNVGPSSAGPEDVDQGKPQMNGSFHSPELHDARLASLNTSHTITQEELKKKQKEDELKTCEQEADKDRMMTENRAQLDAESAHKLSLGRNRSTSKSHQESESEDEDSKKGSRRKRKSQAVQEETGDSRSPQPVESNDMEETGDSQSSQPVESRDTWVQGGKDDGVDDTGSLASQPSLCSVAPPLVAPDPRLVEMMGTLKSLQQQFKQLQEMAKRCPTPPAAPPPPPPPPPAPATASGTAHVIPEAMYQMISAQFLDFLRRGQSQPQPPPPSQQ